MGAATAGGSVDVGTHQYAVTFLDAAGKETTPSANSATATASTGNQTIPLSAIPTGGSGTVQRRLYRSKVGTTGPLYLLATIADNSTTTYSDATADASLGAATPPAVNGTGLACAYLVEGQPARAQVALVAGTVGTWSGGGFKEVDPTYLPGVYELGVPNAALTGGNSAVLMLFGAANMVPVLVELELDAIPYATGLMLLDQTQAITSAPGPGTLGDALIAAEAQGVGKWTLVGTTLTLYRHDGTTVARTFTLDSSSAPTQRS